MALRETKAATQPAPGAFEETGSTVTAEAPKAPAQQAPAEAGVKAGSEVAAAPRAGVPVLAGGKMVSLLHDFRNAIPKLDFGVLPRLVGTQGQIQNKDTGALLGDNITIQLVSYNDEFVVSPGDDAADAKELVRYSDDGKVLNDGSGTLVADHLKLLRETHNYPDASVKKYVQVIGIVLATAKPSDLVEQMVLISLSPQSAKAFQGYDLQESVKLRLGSRTTENASILKVSGEVKTQGGNTFTLLKVSQGVAPAQ